MDKETGAAIYARISEDREGRRLGVQRQIEDCNALAARLGWSVGAVYEDNDLSAFKKGNRPAFDRLARDVASGKVQRLLVYHMWRLWRQPEEFENVVVKKFRGVDIQTVTSGPIDLSTPTGRHYARNNGANASLESELLGERVSRKMAELKAAGKWTGGPRPFGWDDKGMNLHPKEAKLLRDAAARILRGESLHSIVSDWYRAGVRGTRSGGTGVIKTSTLKRMLTSPRVVGRNGITKAEWAPIFTDESEWQQLCAILSGKRRSRPTRAYMLTGEILRCGRCGGPLYGSLTFGGKASPHYSCKRINGVGCAGIAIPMALTNEAVGAQITEYVQSPKFKARLAKLQAANPGLGKASVEIQKVNAALAEIAADRDSELITRDEYLTRRANLAVRLKAAQSALEAAQSEVTEVANFAWFAGGNLGDWGLYDPDERRRLVLALIERVTILPGVKGVKSTAARVEVKFR